MEGHTSTVTNTKNEQPSHLYNQSSSCTVDTSSILLHKGGNNAHVHDNAYRIKQFVAMSTKCMATVINNNRGLKFITDRTLDKLSRDDRV